MAAIHKTGNWQKAARLTGQLDSMLNAAATATIKHVGLEAEALAKRHLANQDLGWEPLQPATIAAKKKKGYSSLTLIRSSSYMQAITSWVENKEALVGVRRQIRGKDGELIADIARIHEYGSIKRNIPRRPLWHPVLAEIRQRLAQGKGQELFLEKLKSVSK
jgi:hypothetical protein